MKRYLSVSLLTLCIALPSVAEAWQNRTQLKTAVLGHRFVSASVANGPIKRNKQCVVTLKLKFHAPTHRYHRFQAKIIMKSGAWLRTPLFFNNGSGERVYTFRHNTAYKGCWGAKYHRIRNIVVHSCSGYDCRLKPIL